MLEVKGHPAIAPELEYTLKFVLEDVLGLEYRYIPESIHRIEFCVDGEPETVSLKDTFFKSASQHWLLDQSLPSFSGEETFCLTEGAVGYPLFFDALGDADQCTIPFDLLGTVFFLISRYEEGVSAERDAIGRFPSTASTTQNFLDRPLVDEAIELLWSILKKTWPGLRPPKDSSFSTMVTCDVDFPFELRSRSFSKTLRATRKALFSGQGMNPLEPIHSYLCHRLGCDHPDAMKDRLSWMMDEAEKKGHQIAFYFIPEVTSSLDPPFDILSKQVGRILENIHSRGHELGIHPGYRTSEDVSLLSSGFSKFGEAMEGLGLPSSGHGCRMHFLRFDVMKTPMELERQGCRYDTSLGYADRAGFRCGTSKPFHMYNLKERTPLKLIQIPLIAMEGTILDSKYESLGYGEDAKNRFLQLKRTCERYGGKFTFLWHNSHFESKEDEELFLSLL